MKTNQYESMIKKHEVRPNYLKNMIHAFLIGGLICLFGQTLHWMFMNVLNHTEQEATTHMIVTIIILASILTGLGVYDKLGQFGKAGAFVPISGFANSMTASAMEGKSEGIVLGIAANMFKLAGTILVVAVMSGFFFGIIRYLLQQWGIVPELMHDVVLLVQEVLV